MTDADLGRAGEDRVCRWLNCHPLVDLAVVNTPNPMHGYADVGFAMKNGDVHVVQVKTKTNYCSSPNRPFPCGRTGMRSPRREREHGFEAARLDRYRAAGASVVIVEDGGAMLVLPMTDEGLEAVGIRYRCHSDCPRYRRHGRGEHCAFFFYVDRDILFEHLRLPPEPDLAVLEKMRVDFNAFARTHRQHHRAP